MASASGHHATEFYCDTILLQLQAKQHFCIGASAKKVLSHPNERVFAVNTQVYS